MLIPTTLSHKLPPTRVYGAEEKLVKPARRQAQTKHLTSLLKPERRKNQAGNSLEIKAMNICKKITAIRSVIKLASFKPWG